MRTFAILVAAAGLVAAEPVHATIQADGHPSAVVDLPPGWSCAGTGPELTIIPPARRPHIQAWALPSGMLPAAAAPQAAALIAGQVLEFQSAATASAVIAGNPAVVLTGTGIEADDNDPATAEITLFTVGARSFLCVVHGEGDGTARHHDAVHGILSTAHVP